MNVKKKVSMMDWSVDNNFEIKVRYLKDSKSWEFRFKSLYLILNLNTDDFHKSIIEHTGRGKTFEEAFKDYAKKIQDKTIFISRPSQKTITENEEIKTPYFIEAGGIKC